ncbi:hypothetical protein LIER_30934 [Lithospermum erythrorhizon]|uniref:Uncharacterized protein n=1 Tax=Lithospermum erythrorhizon TaxID=34254 RepID=A0AAV3RPB0_LITER
MTLTQGGRPGAGRYTKPHSLNPGQNRPKAYVYMCKLVNDEVSSWFIQEMRFEWRDCWPRWKNVNTRVQDRLWNNFKNYFDIEVEESTAKHLFFKQASLWYRRSMGVVKKEALEAAKSEDVVDFLGQPKLPWMQMQAVWDCFIKHWTDLNTIKKSNSRKKSWETEWAVRYGLGNVSLKKRMRKRGKYVMLFKVWYGQDLDLKNYPPDLNVWDVLEEVEDGRKKGRRLGFGT